MSQPARKVKLKQLGNVASAKGEVAHASTSVLENDDDDDDLHVVAANGTRTGARPIAVLDSDDEVELVQKKPKKSKAGSSKAASRKRKAVDSDEDFQDNGAGSGGSDMDLEPDPSDASEAGNSEQSEQFSDDADDLSISEDSTGNVTARKRALRKPAAAKATPAKGPAAQARKRRAVAQPAAPPGRKAQKRAADASDSEDSGMDEGTITNDFRHLELKEDHAHRPLWVLPDGRIFLETFSPVYKQAYDFLIAIAEPVSRPEIIHEYALTVHSLYAAVSVGLPTDSIVTVLNRLSKNHLDDALIDMIRTSTENYGKVKLVLQRNRLYVESPSKKILKELLRNKDIAEAHAAAGGGGIIAGHGRSDLAASALAAEMVNIDLTKAAEGLEDDEEAKGDDKGVEKGSAAVVTQGAGEGTRTIKDGVVTANATSDAAGGEAGKEGGLKAGAGGEACEAPRPVPFANDSAIGPLSADDIEIYSFEIAAAHSERVKKLCLPEALNYPMLEEYDFRNDTVNPDIPYELKPIVKHRPYQEKGLAKMFGNGRARSGIIVLPCGAGKSLTGISAAVRTRKSVLVLVTNAVSVDQWTFQFKQWTTIAEENLGKFTSADKAWFKDDAGVMICTYSMIAGSHRRAADSQRIFDAITGREWGLILLDEVHVVPAEMFRKVVGIIKAHCKLGLTATLVREDERINDLNFLIGPKLYEANWLDLTRAGHIANVRCCEVWCDMDKDFYAEYLREAAPNRRITLSVMNPEKFRACQFLVRYHEEVRRDKVIVFSDNILALKEYAVRMKKFFVYGGTGHTERTQVLRQFKTSDVVNTVFLSKVGDNSLDIPEANVLIQISSHAGSRRQEAQRLGRILRAKPGQDPNEFNAFFYTLVSKDTQEMYFSTKRQRFLIDQGYSYQTITNLLGSGSAAEVDLDFGKRKERLDLLAKVKSHGEALDGVEADADNDGLPMKPSHRRKAAKLAEYTGADASYHEFSVSKPKKKSGTTLAKMLRKR